MQCSKKWCIVSTQPNQTSSWEIIYKAQIHKNTLFIQLENKADTNKRINRSNITLSIIRLSDSLYLKNGFFNGKIYQHQRKRRINHQ